MQNKWWLFAGALLGTAEQTIPIFIHNAKSQTIEAVVVTDGNQLFTTLATILAAPQQATTQPSVPLTGA